MKTLTTPRRFETWVALLTAACVAVAAATSVRAVDIVVGVPLALFLPGAALVTAIDPWHRQTQGPERAMWFLGASIGIVIMGGLILNLTGGLTRPHWLIFTAAIVGVLLVAGWIRSATPATSGEEPGEAAPASRGVGGLGFRAIALGLAAVVVVVGALVVSQRSNAESTREHFVQAWILPQPTGNVYSTKATIGVRNEEGSHETIVISVKGGATMRVGLDDGQAWTHQISRAPGKAVSVTVALASNPSTVLDRVDLAKPA